MREEDDFGGRNDASDEEDDEAFGEDDVRDPLLRTAALPRRIAIG
jgi:hypothetical protein